MVGVGFGRHNHGRDLLRIVVGSVILHIVVVALILAFFWIQPKKRIEPVPIFELVKVDLPQYVPPKPKIAQPTPPRPTPVEEPKPREDIKPKPESKPEPQPQIAPEPRPAEKPTAEPAPSVPETQTADTEMDLPDFDDMPQLRTVESILIDPLMQVYLEQLQIILMQNFNPPAGVDISKYAKTTVQFTIQRNGEITGVILKKSSGNPTWDRLAVRAVNISKLPPLPPNYRAPVLPLVFDFREK